MKDIFLVIICIILLIIVGFTQMVEQRKIKQSYCEDLGPGNHIVYPCGNIIAHYCQFGNLSITVECD